MATTPHQAPIDEPASSSVTPASALAAPVRWGGWAALLILLAWGGMVGLSLLVSLGTGRDVPTCLFRRVTGLPCATCGGTRVVYALSQGHVLTALQLNPLVTLLLLSAPIIAVAAWLRSRRPTPRAASDGAPTPLRKHVLWVALFLPVLGLNWIYVAREGSLARQPTSSLAERWQQRTQEPVSTGTDAAAVPPQPPEASPHPDGR